MAADGSLHERIMAHPVVVDGVLISAGDRHRPGGHHLEHLMQDAVRITAIRHRRRETAAHAELALSLPQQQQACVGRLVAAGKIHCEFLAADGWKVKGKRRIDGHDGCGAAAVAPGGSSGQRLPM
jgi:hypothetical protein